MECQVFLRTIGLRQRVVCCEGAEQNQRLGRGTFASEISTPVDIGKHRCHQFRLSQFRCQVSRSRSASTQALAECIGAGLLLSRIQTVRLVVAVGGDLGCVARKRPDGSHRPTLSPFSVSLFCPIVPFRLSAFQHGSHPPPTVTEEAMVLLRLGGTLLTLP